MFSGIPPERLLTVNDLLEILPLSRPTISRLTRSGKLRGLRVGRRLLFDRREVAAFLEGCHE